MSDYKIKPLKGFNAFNRVFGKGKKFVERDIMAVVIYSLSKFEDFKIREDDSNEYSYVGVSVSKKICKKAVVRNRVKRLLRVSVRSFFSNHSPTGLKYLTISWRQKADSSSMIRLKDIEPRVHQLLNKIIQNVPKGT
ncbi:MAG: ribonuclease P protein component [Ignavibacteriae bacterium HGW-Ignavibacteriae-1]|jgi:ribonuclease P protein component|nr:MAG: ribonuclease P protein component [Ignavibacteriae bacterium HGW-Ignavibacteriae-1]